MSTSYDQVSRRMDRPHGRPQMTLADIRADFAVLDDWESRYRYVIELGRTLPPMPAAEKTAANKVRGCASQVWLASHLTVNGPDGVPRLRFSGDSDAHIVRGLIAILFALYDGMSPQEILRTDPRPLFAELGLQDHLTPQRSNGLAAMAERIRADARAAVTAAPAG